MGVHKSFIGAFVYFWIFLRIDLAKRDLKAVQMILLQIRVAGVK